MLFLSSTVTGLCATLLMLCTALPLNPRQAPASLPFASSSNTLDVIQLHGRHSASNARNYGSAPLTGLKSGWGDFGVNVSVRGQDFMLLLDTGSSDTWIISEGFECVDSQDRGVPEASCYFGAVYAGTYENRSIPGENFQISYGDGDFVSGTFGYSDVTIAGINVKDQQIALVDRSHWTGDGTISGLVGLAYSALTNAYVGTDSGLDDGNITGTAPGNRVPYSPIVTSMITQGLNPPLFSLSLTRPTGKRPAAGGYLAFGGLPPVSVDPAAFVSTPIVPWQYSRRRPALAENLGFYSILPDAYVYNNKTGFSESHPSELHAIVDSGSSALIVPAYVADGYYDSFENHPVFDGVNYWTSCNTTAPPFGIRIGGSLFNVSSADIIVPYPGLHGYKNRTTGEHYCEIAILPAAHDLVIIGDAFLYSVVAVFDVGASMMRFAPHIY